MRKVGLLPFLWLLVCLFSLMILTSCDASLEIVGMEIVQYPKRIVYVVGFDEELDLSGGVINYILKSGDKVLYLMQDEREVFPIYEIDFDEPGIYIVKLSRHLANCEFPIQVIPQDYIETRVEDQ